MVYMHNGCSKQMWLKNKSALFACIWRNPIITLLTFNMWLTSIHLNHILILMIIQPLITCFLWSNNKEFRELITCFVCWPDLHMLLIVTRILQKTNKESIRWTLEVNSTHAHMLNFNHWFYIHVKRVLTQLKVQTHSSLK